MAEMDSLLQNECIVTGTLGLVLRMSRIVGVAPLKFKKTRDGWIARVSPAAYIYGQVLGFTLTLLAVSTLAIEIWRLIEKSQQDSSVTIIWMVDVVSSMLVVSVAVFTGLYRTKCLVGCIIQMQKINLKLHGHHIKCSNERIRMIVVMGSMSVTIFVLSVLVYHTIIATSGINKIGYKLVLSGMHIFFIASTIILEVIIIQFSQLVMSVVTSLRTLNKYFKSLLQEIVDTSASYTKQPKTDHTSRLRINQVSHKAINRVIDTMAVGEGTPEASQSIPAKVRQVSSLYCCICDVVRQINDSHGPVLITLLLSLLLDLIITPYHAITNIFKKSRTPSNPYIQMNWGVLHVTNLLMIIEPCHQTHTEMNVTKQLLSQITRFAQPEHRALMSELEMFYRHLMLNNVTYSPLAMFTLNRALIVTIVGSIATYLVVIIQF